jgi:two-component system, sensor histidine kinase and response regulator
MKPDPINLLIVDDTEDNLLVLEALLRRDDLEIFKAHSGAEALELLLVHEFALAILDVQMPEMNGFELAELMRGAARTRSVPIIFVTAGARDPLRVFKGYETGAVDFLYKPIEPHILKSKVEVFFELYRQRRELAQALRLNEMFVGILGHDLRNPLSAILTGAQVLEADAATDSQQRVLRRMKSAAHRMTNMIEQMLDLTRARLAGGLGFVRTRSRVNIQELVQRTIEELRGTHAERVIVVDADGDCITSGDEDSLLQLFSNLLANALQHGIAETPTLVVVNGCEGDISIRVTNGGAIPQHVLPTIFDPFRGRDSVPSGSRGLGLGLFISQQIVISHGGTISVQSNEELGTTFLVRLPRRS